MAEQGLSPKEATVRSMGQITGALVGIALVPRRCSCPWRSLADRSASSIASSHTIVSRWRSRWAWHWFLRPAIVRHLLNDCPAGAGIIMRRKRGFFGWFNRVFERSSHGYQGLWGTAFSAPDRSFVGLRRAGRRDGLCFSFACPARSCPREDQGLRCDGRSCARRDQEQTKRVVEKMDAHF